MERETDMPYLVCLADFLSSVALLADGFFPMQPHPQEDFLSAIWITSFPKFQFSLFQPTSLTPANTATGKAWRQSVFLQGLFCHSDNLLLKLFLSIMKPLP